MSAVTNNKDMNKQTMLESHMQITEAWVKLYHAQQPLSKAEAQIVRERRAARIKQSVREPEQREKRVKTQ